MRLRWTSLGLFLFVCGCLLAWAPLSAYSDDKPAEEPAVDPAAERADALATAEKMVQYGRATKSPEALIAAAGLLYRIPPAIPDATQPKEPVSLRDEADKLLAEAKTMSGNDPNVVALADAVANRKVARGGKPLPPKVFVPKPPVVSKAPPKTTPSTEKKPTTTGKGNTQPSPYAKQIEELSGIMLLLDKADSDYKGHRGAAMKEIHTAIQALAEGNKEHMPSVKGGGEKQKLSDAQLRAAIQAIAGVQSQLAGKKDAPAVKAATALGTAVKQLQTALTVK